MKIKSNLLRAVSSFFLFTLVCGVLYTAAITGLSQLVFPKQANGSMIEADGKQYFPLLGQQYTDETHMWGRIVNLDVATYQDADGNPLAYAAPSNLSPASGEYEALVADRVAQLQQAHPDMANVPIPVDLVTCSGSGLDPHISLAAAQYQVSRLAQANGLTNQQVETMIEQCTENSFLGLLGEKTVNVLKVNLMLEGILK